MKQPSVRRKLGLKVGVRGVGRGAALLALVGLSACSNDADPNTNVAAGETARVETYGEVEANGTVIEIRMHTTGPDESSARPSFKPALVKARVGDTITFLPSEAGHLPASIEGMLPDGVEGWEGKPNEPVRFLIPEAGVYGYKCSSHYGAGMVGLIVVEGGNNAATAKLQSHPGLAGGVFARLFAEAGL